MKKLLLLFAISISVFFCTSMHAQNNLYINGNVLNGGAVPFAIYLTDSASGNTDTAYANQGISIFSDTISVPATQGIIYVSFIDCYNDSITQVISYSAGNNSYNVILNFCNFNSSWNEVMACVTVENLTGALVPVWIQGPLDNDTFYFLGTGTQTICDTFSFSSLAPFTVQSSLLDCYGVNDFDIGWVFSSTNVVSGNLNYCTPLIPVHVYGNIAGAGGYNVPVLITDISNGNTFSLVADSTGIFEDTLIMAYSSASTLSATIVDCSGNTVSVYANGTGSFPFFNFNMTYCNFYPNSRQLCVTGLGMPGGVAVPVVIYGPSGVVIDTMFFTNANYQTICNTYPVNMPVGNFTIELNDCDGTPLAYNVLFNATNSSVSGSFNYCSLLPPCYNYWVYDFDPADSTYYITVDSITLATAQSFSWHFGDGFVSSAANPIHQYAYTSLYEVCLIITTAASSTPCTLCRTFDIQSLDKVVVLPQTVGMSEMNDFPVSIYPNPAEDVLFIQYDGNEKLGEIKISDVSGKQVLASPLEFGLNNIQVGDLPSGVFMLRIVTDSELIRHKLLVK